MQFLLVELMQLFPNMKNLIIFIALLVPIVALSQQRNGPYPPSYPSSASYPQQLTNFDTYYKSGLITPASVTNGGKYVWNPNLVWTNNAAALVTGALTNSSGLMIGYSESDNNSYLGLIPIDTINDLNVYFYISGNIPTNKPLADQTWTTDTGTGTLVTSNSPGLIYQSTIFVLQNFGELGWLTTNAQSVNYSGSGVSGGGSIYLGTGNPPTTNCNIQNIAIGNDSLQKGTNDTGCFQNVAIGQGVMSNQSSNQQNVGIGWAILQNSTNSADDVGIGWQCLKSDLGIQNIAIGDTVLRDKKFGNFNQFIGTFAGSAVDGNLWGSVGLGGQVFQQLRSGTNLIAIGNNAGGTLTSGTNDTYIGFGVSAASANEKNVIRIGSTLGDGAPDTYVYGKMHITSPISQTPTAVTLTGSAFTFSNSTSSILECYFSGSVAYSVSKNGSAVFGSLAADGYMLLQPTNKVVITYTVAPTMFTNALY